MRVKEADAVAHHANATANTRRFSELQHTQNTRKVGVLGACRTGARRGPCGGASRTSLQTKSEDSNISFDLMRRVFFEACKGEIRTHP